MMHPHPLIVFPATFPEDHFHLSGCSPSLHTSLLYVQRWLRHAKTYGHSNEANV